MHDLGALPAPLLLVDLRVGLVADEHVAELDHGRRDVGVDVELGDDRRPAHHLAHGGEDMPLAVVDALGHHGAVEVEEDAVHRPGRLQASEHVAEDLVEDVAGDGRAGHGRGVDGGDQLAAVLPAPGQEAADGGVGAVEALEHLRPPQVAEALLAEAVPGGLDGGEGARLVNEGAGGDAHAGGLFRRRP